MMIPISEQSLAKYRTQIENPMLYAGYVDIATDHARTLFAAYEELQRHLNPQVCTEDENCGQCAECVALCAISDRDLYRDREQQLQVQLAGCGVAALGGTQDPANKGDYGWSQAYQDVLDLRFKYDAAEKRVQEMVERNKHLELVLRSVLMAADESWLASGGHDFGSYVAEAWEALKGETK